MVLGIFVLDLQRVCVRLKGSLCRSYRELKAWFLED